MTTPAGISLNLIVKNCAKNLEECLSSVKDFIRPEAGDEIVALDTGSTDLDATVECARRHGARVLVRTDLSKASMTDLVKKHVPEYAAKLAEDPQYDGGFLADFAAARQIVTDASKNDLVFWLDSDDVVEGAAALRDYCAAYFANDEARCLFMRYDYAFDPDGKCNTVLWRERILDRRHHKWAGLCHESMIPLSGKAPVTGMVQDHTIFISHKNGRDHLHSDLRNYVVMLTDYEAQKWKDPRTEYYLGNACRGLSRWSEAIKWYTLALQRSGSRDDRYSCALHLAYCFLMHGRPWRALDWFLQATKIHPSEPRAFFGAARCYHSIGRHSDCVLYTQLGFALPRPKHITALDPNHLDFYPEVFECLSLRELGQAQAALGAAQRLLQLRPGLKEARDLAQETANWAQGEMLKGAVITTTQNAFSNEAAIEILARLRPELRKGFIEFNVEKAATPPTNSITFLCPPTYEPWDPTSLNTGIGGSEKMVILLAREFAKSGWRVDVYGNPHVENRFKPFDGVTYRPFQSFNPKLPRDIVILWRAPALADLPFKARKLYVDMHDIAVDADFQDQDRLRRIAGVFWKSNYHRSTAPSCPEDKCIYTRNAVDLSSAEPLNPKDRNFNKVVWCSSGDRGLLGALTILRRAKAQNPLIEPHIFYGFTPLYMKRAAEVEYQAFGDLGHECHMLDYAERCHTLADSIGAKFHNRVGAKDLAAHLSTAGIWLYPTVFDEISCMSAMEAQCYGAYPLFAPRAALTETITFGTAIDALDHDKYVNAICAIAAKGADLNDYRTQMAVESSARFSLESLAADWLTVFNTAKVAA